jgi:hypothetical protein
MRLPTRLRAAVLAAAVLLAPVPAASAEFRPVNPPPDVKPSGVGLRINSFGAVGDVWVAVDENSRVFKSRDQGANWESVPHDSTTGGGQDFAVGPDGAYQGGTFGGMPGFVRVKPDGSTDAFTLDLPESARGSLGTAAFDDDGTLWVFLSHFRNLSADAPVLTLLRMNADRRTVAERRELAVPKPFDAVSVFRFVGGVPYIRYGNTFASPVLRLTGGRLVPQDGREARIRGKAFQPPATLPAVAIGSTVVGFHGISPDDGLNWGQLWGPGNLLPVAGDTDLLARGDWLLRRAGESFRLSDTALPAGVLQLAQVPGGIVAVGGSGSDAGLYFHRGPVANARDAGSPGAYTRTLLRRLNRFRARAGVPPLIADAGIERAARNHARYLSRNRVRADGIAATLHGETRGRPGFTGTDAEARCTAVGVTCSGDVIVAGAMLSRPADTLIATLYHRLPLLSAATTAVGAARSGRYVVLKFDETGRRGLNLAPVGFPRGTYDGPRSLPDEAPDPRDGCSRNRQPVRRAGTPVTFQTPSEEPPALPSAAFIQSFPLPDVLGVTLFQGRRRVRGCSRVGFLRSPQQHIAFLPEGPLRPRTRYRAVARWRINPAAPVRTYRWTFRTR